MVILIILITTKHFNILDVPNEADGNKLNQDWNKISFNSQELWIYYEYDEYFKLLELYIDVSNVENSQHKELIKIIYHQLNSVKICKYLSITFCDTFNFPKTLGIESNLKYSDVEHELKEVSLVIDFEFHKNEEIKTRLLEYLGPTLKCICRLGASELILKGFSSSLLASLLDNFSKYLQLVCFLRIEEIRGKQLRLDLDGSWTEDLKSLVSLPAHSLEMHFTLRVRTAQRGS